MGERLFSRQLNVSINKTYKNILLFNLLCSNVEVSLHIMRG